MNYDEWYKQVNALLADFEDAPSLASDWSFNWFPCWVAGETPDEAVEALENWLGDRLDQGLPVMRGEG